MPTIQRLFLPFVFFVFVVAVAGAQEQSDSGKKNLTREEVIDSKLQEAIDQARADGTEQTQENFRNIQQKVENDITKNLGKDELGQKQETGTIDIPPSEETTQKSFVQKQEDTASEIPPISVGQSNPMEITEEAPNRQDVRSRLKKVELALQTTWHKYHTNANFAGDEIDKKGDLYGIHMAYTYRRPYKVPVHSWGDLHDAVKNASRMPTFLRLEGDLLFGQVDYDSKTTGKLKNFDAWQGNVRFLGGYDFLSADSSLMVTPYTGIGYRRFSDKTGSWITLPDLTSHANFENIYNYLYIPLGVEALKHINDQWDLGFKLEGSIIVWGSVDFNLGDIPGFYTITDADTSLDVPATFRDSSTNLKGGFGLRTSTQIIKKFQTYNIFAEPFIELWRINQSQKGKILAHGTNGKDYASDANPLYEPFNYTLDFGLRLGVQF